MALHLFGTFLDYLEVFRPVLTAPGFNNMVVILIGWVLDPGAVTQALVATSVSGKTHHEKFHRFFSRGTWCPDKLGLRLFSVILRLLPDQAPIRLAVDDTLAPKKGPSVFGIDSHLDAVRSTKAYRIFCFGHCWVVLAVLVKLPFSKSIWALPILFRLYRNKKTCARDNVAYRKKTELAREMLEVLLSWVDGRRVELTGDSAYCNSTVTSDLPDSVVLIGDMRPDAVLTELPPKRRKNKRGRPPKRGRTLPKPKQVAENNRRPWKSCEAYLYGKLRTVRYKDFFAQWYRACGIRLLHIVIVKVEQGTIGLRVFFSTDPTMTVEQILEGYAQRWSIEVSFRNLKQLLGFADSSARLPPAVERTAPFIGLTYTLLVIWFTEHAYTTRLAMPPVRPWYTHKQGYSFEDVLRTARRVLAPAGILDLPSLLDNLHNNPEATLEPQGRRKRCA
jgi:hypothetical protein